MRKNQAGFSALEVGIVVVIIALIGFAGWWVYKNHKTDTTPTTTTSSHQTSSVSAHGIAITSPKDNATVGRSFTITGTAPASNSQYSESINLVVDHNHTWNLANLSSNNLNVSSNSHFSVPINVSGNKALEESTAVTGGYKYSYKALSAGTHTFTVNLVRTGKIDSLVMITDGPTLTLHIQ
jgi:Tfp pilus assembly protein PilV